MARGNFGERLKREREMREVSLKEVTVATRIGLMFQTALCRAPRPEECESFARFVAQIAALKGVPVDGVLSSAAVWRDVAHTLFNLRVLLAEL